VAPTNRYIYVGLGSNLGDRRGWLRRAIDKLQCAHGIAVIQRSAVYESEPVGYSDQPRFLNQVIEIATGLDPQTLIRVLQDIESRLGRVRQRVWGPRNIDLDLLAYDGRELDTPVLKLPHPEIHRRRFVLLPWAEIAPQFEVPRWCATVAELLEACPDTSMVVRSE